MKTRSVIGAQTWTDAGAGVGPGVRASAGTEAGVNAGSGLEAGACPYPSALTFTLTSLSAPTPASAPGLSSVAHTFESFCICIEKKRFGFQSNGPLMTRILKPMNCLSEKNSPITELPKYTRYHIKLDRASHTRRYPRKQNVLYETLQ